MTLINWHLHHLKTEMKSWIALPLFGRPSLRTHNCKQAKVMKKMKNQNKRRKTKIQIQKSNKIKKTKEIKEPKTRTNRMILKIIKIMMMNKRFVKTAMFEMTTRMTN